MYPNLYYLFKDAFGISLPFLKVFNTFGTVVAISFLVCAWMLIKELKRKEGRGLLTYKEVTITTGEPASIVELIINFFFGFIFGYKFIGLFLTPGASADPAGFIFSSGGNLPAGILLGVLMAFLKWRSKDKLKLPKAEKRIIKIWPSDRVGDLVLIAAVAGFAGAKVFDNLENWNRFIQDPINNLFSRSGLTFYGGLIVAAAVIYFYLRNNKIPFIHVADAIAPGLMFAYGWGRVGCQVAGDGDWGIINSAYITDTDGHVLLGTPQQVHDNLIQYRSIYEEHIAATGEVQHAAVKAFAGLPDWLFAFTYTHNVNREGIPLAHCNWDDYCTYLPLPVFPTPFYEVIMGLLLCLLLWRIRKKFHIAGRMFAVYLFVNGIERFLIEQIRVNTKYNFGFIHPTQAQLISFSLIIAGIVLYWYAPRLNVNKRKLQPAAV